MVNSVSLHPNNAFENTHATKGGEKPEKTENPIDQMTIDTVTFSRNTRSSQGDNPKLGTPDNYPTYGNL